MQTAELERGGGRLKFAVSGRVHAPTLVLLHPLGANRDVWWPQLSTFEQFFHVVRPDLRGHGESGVSEGEPSTRSLLDYVEDVLAILDHLHVDRAHWCGLSMGGAIALQAAISHPKRVQRLVLANTSAEFGSTDLRAGLGSVQAATLVIAGARDVATPIEQAEALREGITGADLAVLDASHLSNVEQAEDFTALVTGFLRD